MSKILVVYYSLTSHTRQIAEVIAAACDADLEGIEDTFNRDTGSGRFRSAFESLLGLHSSIFPSKHDPHCHRQILFKICHDPKKGGCIL